MSIKGVDVSSYNGIIDWSQAKNHVGFAILRCHQKYGIDEQFERNYAECKKYHIPVGVYKYSYAMSISDARKEARDVVKVLKGKRLEYPVFYDLEEEAQIALGANKIQKMAVAFMKIIVKAGYGVGIYCNKNWYYNHITSYLKKNYSFWIASPPAEESDTGVPVERIKPKKAMCWQYSWKGKIPGINGDADLDLMDYIDDTPVSEPAPTPTPVPDFTSTPAGVTPTDVINVAVGWLGFSEANGLHKKIIDIYNSYLPHPRGYAVTYTDSWCDATVSAIFIFLKAVDKIGGIECGVEEHVKKFKAAGIWIEDGSIVPKPGDLIVYNWDDSTQPNDGYSDHIGIVEKVSGSTITTIEGNSSNMVKRNNIPVGYGYIRGFARPKYD